MIDTIITGDCVNVMATFPAGSVDLVVTSPPYDNLREYNGYHFDFEAIAGQLWRVIKPGGVVVWVVGDATINGSETGTSFRQALHFMSLGFRLHDTMIWERKGFGTVGNPPRRYSQDFEYVFIFSKGTPAVLNFIKERNKYAGAKMTGRTRRNKQADGKIDEALRPMNGDYNKKLKVKSNVWHIPAGYNHSAKDNYVFEHPAIFPESLAHDHIISWSNPGDIVLDPMCGSGTTCKMAMLTGRHYIGIDISAEYCELARVRVARAKARTVEAFENGDAMPGREVGNTEELPLFAYKGGDA